MPNKLQVKKTEISIRVYNQSDFISLTDTAKAKNPDEPKDVVKNWLRSKSTVEFLGLWEQINNDNFKGVEFDTFRNEADVLNVALFGVTAEQWRSKNKEKKGNIRDYASVEQLIILSNMESVNAFFLEQNISQNERLTKLNQLAITQMKSLLKNKSIKKLAE